MSAKRKAAASTAASMDDAPDAKRRKVPAVPRIAGEKQTPESTTEVGLGFMAQIKAARDKRHKLIATNFLTLPDKKQLPEYYQAIALPVALDTIEAKLKRRDYPSLSTVEGDLKRMVSNAKSYNERTSEVFSDAEKIRKMVSNWMMKNNPAYKDGSGYVPLPTPIPGDTQNGTKKEESTKQEEEDADADGETDPEEAVAEKPRRTVTLHGPSAQKEEARRRQSSTPAMHEAEDAGESFDGNNFQQAQEKIVTEMIQLKNEQDQVISSPFLNLPSRELRDYYRLIKHPQCLKGIQKLVRGIKGRDKPSGTSLFKSWQAFEDEVSNIWNNARLYNEDGSPIFELANEIEVYFKGRLSEAKIAVAEPAQPKVKLRMTAKSPDPAPKIKLRFGQKAIHDEGSGVTIDNDALKRQQDLVKAGANGYEIMPAGETPSQPSTRTPFRGASQTPNVTTTTAVNQLLKGRRSDSAGSPPVAVNGVKNESAAEQSPALAAVRPVSSGSNETKPVPAPLSTPALGSVSMPPPASVTPRLPSVSPNPQTVATHAHTSHAQHITNPLDSRWRQPGKGAADALISNLLIATHPGLKLDRHFRLNIPPSETYSQQSITINLSSTHYCLQITPTISANLSQRQTRLFVTLGNTRLNPSPAKTDGLDPTCPVYDTRVMPGLNRIEVEMIAGPPRGVPKVGAGQDIELEKITVFVNILRS